MPDSSAIDAAVVSKLGSDAALLALMPNGVHFDVAPKGFTRFVVVSLASALDTDVFESRGYESITYLVKAVSKGTNGADVRSAAARIDELLDRGTLTVAGYSLMQMARSERVRYTETDLSNPDVFWQHRGGMYDVVMST